MTLTNHVLAGSLLAKLLPLPVAIPLAFLSHFVLDSLPHFGVTEKQHQPANMILDRVVIGIDIATFIAVAIWLISNGRTEWLLVGLVAFSPDSIWVYRYVIEEKFGTLPEKAGGWFVKFHAGIQKFEFQQGWAIEILVGLLLVNLVAN